MGKLQIHRPKASDKTPFQPVSRPFAPASAVRRTVQDPAAASEVAPQHAANKTGMPDNLKSGIESLSGMSLDHTKVHYNSAQPAQLNALAYAQGTDIHVAPGQEQHLPHEAWHVVQQAQGRVKPTAQMKDGVPVNDDVGLELEADLMGETATQKKVEDAGLQDLTPTVGAVTGSGGRAPIQAVWDPTNDFSTLQWHKLENQLQWFYKENDDKYFFIVDGEIPNDDPNYSTIHGESYYQKSWDDWQVFVVRPPRKFRKQDDRRLSPEVRYEAVKADPSFVAPNPTANPTDISDALDLGLSVGVQTKFDAMAAQVDPGAQARQSLADKDVYRRIPPVFNRIKTDLTHGRLEPTPDLIKKINDTLALNRYEVSAINSFLPATAARALKSASEALSEVQYAAIVLGTNTVRGGYVLGAQGPVWSPGQAEAPNPEVQHGGLPPLDVLRLEVDGYYQSRDGMLHADEVKDTPRAMAEKVKKGEQLARQVEWLRTPAIKNTGALYEKQVGYYVQAPGPGFDNLLDETVIDNLRLIEQNQEPNPKLILVDTQSFTLEELETMMNRAFQWLTASKRALDQQGIRIGVAAQRYFGDLQTANNSLADGPLVV